MSLRRHEILLLLPPGFATSVTVLQHRVRPAISRRSLRRHLRALAAAGELDTCTNDRTGRRLWQRR